MTVNLRMIAASRATEICAHLPLGEGAQALLDRSATPAEFMERLLAHAYYPDAARFLAQALPKREAVRWACRCARVTGLADAPVAPADDEALAAAEAWVAHPGDAAATAAMAKAEATDLASAGAWAAVAAFWSGDSLAAGGGPDMAPADTLTALAVAGAVTLAAVRGQAPGETRARFRTFLEMGLELAGAGHATPRVLH